MAPLLEDRVAVVIGKVRMLKHLKHRSHGCGMAFRVECAGQPGRQGSRVWRSGALVAQRKLTAPEALEIVQKDVEKVLFVARGFAAGVGSDDHVRHIPQR